MKRTLLAVAAAILFAGSAFAQTPAHSVTLTWTPPADAVASSTVSIFRATGACTPAPTFGSPLITGVAMTPSTFTDTTVTPGVYCYTAVHVLNGASAVNSNLAGTSVSPLPILNVTITVTK